MILIATYQHELIEANTSAECGTSCIKVCDQMWIILTGMGAFPGLIALYFGLTIPKSSRYSLDVNFHDDFLNYFEDGSPAENSVSEKHSLTDAELEHHSSHDIEKHYSHATPSKASFKDFCHQLGNVNISNFYWVLLVVDSCQRLLSMV